MIVVDASVVADLLLDEPLGPTLIGALSGQEMLAPDLLDYEFANTVRGHLLGGHIDHRGASRATTNFEALDIERFRMTHELASLLRLYRNFTAYDAAYIVLARTFEVPLLTADAGLADARRLGVEIQLV